MDAQHATQVVPGSITATAATAAAGSPIVALASGGVVFVCSGTGLAVLQRLDVLEGLGEGSRCDVTAVAWSATCKLAAGSSGSVTIFDPSEHDSRGAPEAQLCPYRWAAVARLPVGHEVSALSWRILAGWKGEEEHQLLVAGASIEVWSLKPLLPKKDSIADRIADAGAEEDASGFSFIDADETSDAPPAAEKAADESEAAAAAAQGGEEEGGTAASSGPVEADESWRVNSAPASAAVSAGSFSWDGAIFATATELGKNAFGMEVHAEQVWFEVIADARPPSEGGGATSWEAESLQHPAEVRALAWKRGSGPLALMTVCASGELRVWVAAAAAKYAAPAMFVAATIALGDGPQTHVAQWISAAPGDKVSSEWTDNSMGLLPRLHQELEWVGVASSSGAFRVWGVEGMKDFEAAKTQAQLTVREPWKLPKGLAGGSVGLRSLSVLCARDDNVTDDARRRQVLVQAVLIGHGDDGTARLWEVPLSDHIESMVVPAATRRASMFCGRQPSVINALEAAPAGGREQLLCIADDQLTVYRTSENVVSFAVPPLERLAPACLVGGDAISAACWLSQSESLLVCANESGLSVLSVPETGHLHCEDDCLDNLELEMGAAVTQMCTACLEGGKRWLVLAVVLAYESHSIVGWELTLLPGGRFEQRTCLEHELPDGAAVPSALAMPPPSSTFSVSGPLANHAEKNEDGDTQSQSPSVLMLGDAAGGVTVFEIEPAKAEAGAEPKPPTNDELIEQAVASMPEPRRSTMAAALKRMPPAALPKALERMGVKMPAPGDAPPPAAEEEAVEEGKLQLTQAAKVACEGGGAVSSFAIADTGLFAAVIRQGADAGSGGSVTSFATPPCGWPRFEQRYKLDYDGLEVVGAAFHLSSERQLLAVGLAETIEIHSGGKRCGFGAGSEPWSFSRLFGATDGIKPIHALAWVGQDLVLAAGAHVAVYGDAAVEPVGEAMISDAQRRQPDYHPEQLEGLLVSGNEAMLGATAAHALSLAPEEWEGSGAKWRPGRTPLDALAKAEDKAGGGGGGGADPYAFGGGGIFASFTGAKEAETIDGPAESKKLEKRIAAGLEDWDGRSQLEDLSVSEMMHLQAVLKTYIKQHELSGALDMPGKRYFTGWQLSALLATGDKDDEKTGMFAQSSKGVRGATAPKENKVELPKRELLSAHYAWAYHSDSQKELLATCLPAKPKWADCKAAGVGLWVRSPLELKRLVDLVAKSTFAANRKPHECALFYLALEKKSILLAMYKATGDTKVHGFMSKEFEGDSPDAKKNRTMAAKNALKLLSQRQFELSAAFFLISGPSGLTDALNVCVKNMKDLQLAIVLCRLVKGDEHEMTQKLYRDLEKSATESKDVYTASIALWTLGEYVPSVQVLCGSSVEDSVSAWYFLEHLCNKPVVKQALTTEQTAPMVQVAIDAAMTHAEADRPLQALQVLSSFFKWPHTKSMAAHRVNSYGLINLMHVVSGELLYILAAGDARSGDKGEPVLETLALLGSEYGLCQSSLLSALAAVYSTSANFSLVQELATASAAMPVHATAAAAELVSLAQALAATATMVVQRPTASTKYASCIDSMCSSLFQAARWIADAPLSPKSVGGVILVGRFCSCWLRQDFKALFSTFFPRRAALSSINLGEEEEEEHKGELLSVPRVLFMLLARLCFTIKPPEEASGFDRRSAPEIALEADLLRGIWCSFNLLQSMLSSSPDALESLLPQVPVASGPQLRWYKLLSHELVHVERAANEIRALPGASDVISESVQRTGVLSEMVPTMLFSSAKDAPFRDMCFDASEPTTLAIASGNSITEIDLKSLLRGVGAATKEDEERPAQKLLARQRKVSCLASHPFKPFYISGADDGGSSAVEVWRFGTALGPLAARPGGTMTKVSKDQITKIRFNGLGSQVGVADASGLVSIFWNESERNLIAPPSFSQVCHSRGTSDFAFLNDGSVIVTAGSAKTNENVCIWDSRDRFARVHAQVCLADGATSVAYSTKHQMVFVGGEKGEISLFDLRMRKIASTMEAHSSAVQTLSVGLDGRYFYTGSNGGDIRVWDMNSFGEAAHMKGAHVRAGLMSTGIAKWAAGKATNGVVQICNADHQSSIVSCGADASIKLWQPRRL